MFPYLILSFNLRACGSIAARLISTLRIVHSGLDYELNLVDMWQTLLFIFSPLFVIILPLLLDKLISELLLCGFVAGVILSGIQMAISMLGSGAAWAMVNQQIEI